MADSARQADAVDVILRDGGTLRLRPPVADDASATVDFFRSLSERSRYLRFHGARPVDERLAEPFLDPDWIDRGALVGELAGDDRRERIVALASYSRLREPSAAEVAFAVADPERGRGIGTRLLEQLATRAGEAGVETFVADVMGDNGPALRVFADAGFELTRELEGGEVELRFPIAATEGFRARVAARDHTAVVASMRPFFEPRTVAVAGASRRPGSIGGALFRNIVGADFAGTAYPVNRGGDSIAGVRAFTSVGEISEAIDLAVICVPAARVIEAAESALRSGVRALCVISSGFAEVGPDGRELQERLLALVRSYGARLVGPNCLGIAVARSRLNATFAGRPLPPGAIGFSSQSGALGLALLEKATERRLGFSAFVSVGNKADVSTNDLLEWWEDDAETDLVLLYVESFGNPRTFGRVSRRLARSKPILALKAGTTAAGARAASSHTAALAGSEAAVDALFRQAGVLRARTLEELVDAAALLSHHPLPRGRRVAIVTNAGGLGILCADACEAAGLELPELCTETLEALRGVLPPEASVANPVDLLGSATAETYEATLPALLLDPRLDAVLVLFVPPVVAGAGEVAAAIARAADAGAREKPVLAVVVSADGTPPVLRDDPRVATFPYPESAARSLGLAAERAEWLRRPAGTVVVPAGIDVDAARRIAEAALGDSGHVWLDAENARALVLAYGIPLVEQRVVDGADGAVVATHELGLPAVVKSAAPGVHKTERGAVALDLRDDTAIRAAAERIGAPLLVQPYVHGGPELLAGVVQDPVFGPIVAFGPGGVLAELIGDAGFRIAPLTDVDAAELVHGGKAGRLVRGYRGSPPADGGALVDLVQRLARLCDDLPEVAELDLNPVIGLPSGCVALDLRVRLAARPRARPLKGW